MLGLLGFKTTNRTTVVIVTIVPNFYKVVVNLFDLSTRFVVILAVSIVTIAIEPKDNLVHVDQKVEEVVS